MSQRDKSFYIEVILEHIAAIKSYTPNSKEEYLIDEKSYDAILMRLTAVGEELVNIREILEQKNPVMEWHKVIGLRNRIVHGYGEVDKDVIWELLTDGSYNELVNALH